MKKLTIQFTLFTFLCIIVSSCIQSNEQIDPEQSLQSYYDSIHSYNTANINRLDRELIKEYKVPRLNSFLAPVPKLEDLKYIGVNTISIGSDTSRIPEFQENGYQLLTLNKPHTNYELLAKYPKTHQVIFDCSKHVKATENTLEIELHTEDQSIHYKGDEYWRTNPEALNYPGDKYWRVFDVTAKTFLDRKDWKRDPNSTVVQILIATPGHEYGVLYQTKQLHKWIAKKGTISPMFDGMDEVFINWHRENYASYKGVLDVYRPTSASIHRGGGWFGYLCGTNPQTLEEFEEWSGEKFDPVWVLNNNFKLITLQDEPHPGMLKWMKFVQEKSVALNKKVNAVMHEYVPVLRLFWGDNWIGLEPWLGGLDKAGFDEVTKGAHNSVVYRMITDFPGQAKRNFRFSPWMNELQLFNPDLYGKSPLQYARKNWNELRRAMFFHITDGFEFGGNGGDLWSGEFPEMPEQLRRMADEYLFIHNQTAGSKVFTHDLNVYIINSYGALRSWIGWGGEYYNYDPLRFQLYLTDLPINVKFISMNNIIENGIPENADVLINYGDKGSAWSGGSAWEDERLRTAVNNFVNKGGGFIGVGNPSSTTKAKNWYMSKMLGVDFDDKSDGIPTMNRTKNGNKHWISSNLPTVFTNLNNDVKVKTVKSDVQVLYEQDGVPMMTSRVSDKGRVLYLSSYAVLPPKSAETWNLNDFATFDYPYDISNDFYNLVRRSIFWAAGQEENLEKLYSPDENISVYAYPGKNLLIAYNREFNERTVTVKVNPEIFNIKEGKCELYNILTKQTMGTYSINKLTNGVELTIPAEGASFIKLSEVK